MKLVQLQTSGDKIKNKKQAVLVYYDEDVSDIDFTVTEDKNTCTALIVRDPNVK